MKIFKCPIQVVLTWLSQKGYAGNIDEMLMQYLISLDGYQAGASCQDYLTKRLQKLSYLSNTNTITEAWGAFVIKKTGINDTTTAEIAFFSNPTTTFS